MPAAYELNMMPIFFETQSVDFRAKLNLDVKLTLCTFMILTCTCFVQQIRRCHPVYICELEKD
jgi:hypothetical protein